MEKSNFKDRKPKNKNFKRTSLTARRKSFKNNSQIKENFDSSKSASFIDGILWYLPFFVKWPIKFFFWAFFKGLTNPIYIIGLFILFTVIKRVVKNNTIE
jgi:hypothetical protein|tara:strand:- start:450 stop:749 length:300 start_codon:yes stop_codon:yes gene_type:complete